MKHKFSKVFFVVAMLLVVCLFAVACNDGNGNDTDPVKYAVSYVGGEGATGTAPNGGEYAQGAKFTLPDAGTLSKSDYNFGGWSYGGQTYAAGAEFTMPASAVEFVAVWNPVQSVETYAVAYNANGASGTVPTESEKAAGAKFNLASADGLSKANYVFGGWSYNEQIYAAGAEFTMPASAVEFVAVWNEESLPATFKSDDNDALSELDIQLYEDEEEGGYYYYGILSIKDGDDVEVIGEIVGKSVAIKTVESYDSLGTGSFSGGQFNIAILYNGKYYVYGNATYDSVTVTFDPNNGDDTWSVKVGVGLYCDMPEATESSDGKAFINWKATTGATALAGGRFKVSQDMTFVAQYSWVVSFEAGEGATGSIANHTIAEWGSTYFIILPDSTGLSYEGMKFVGWTCDGGTTVLQAGDRYSDGSGNMTFTAVWEVAEASDIRTYVLVGATSTDNGRTTKIVIDLTTGNITQTSTNMFGTSESTAEYTATIEDGKYKVNFASVGSNVWLVVSEDKQTLKMYDWSSCDDDSDLVGTYTLEA